MMNNKTLIIAEIGVNHNGDMNLAYQLIDEAAKAGADAVKFQSFSAENLVSIYAKKVSYQLETTSDKESHYDMIKRLELTEDQHRLLFDYSLKRNIEFISTPYDLDSVRLLSELGVNTFKTASADIVDLPLHESIAKTKKNVIIATGMATLEEIEEVVNIYPERNKITLLHCVSNYPCSNESLNLRSINTLKSKFNTNVGFSDHTIGSLASIISISLGAKVIEKHFTLDKNLPGPDHKASSTFIEFVDLVKSIRSAEIALGSSIKQCQNEEKQMLTISRKSIVYSDDLRKGEKITIDNIALKRPGTGLYSKEIKNILGKRLKHDVFKDHILNWSDLE